MAFIALVASVVALSGPVTPTGAVVAQPRDEQVLRIASVSPWVTPDGEFQVRFEPSTSVPADADLTITIHQPLDAEDDRTLRAAVQEIVEGQRPERVLQTPSTVPFALLGDPTSGAALTIPIRPTRGDAERVLLPNAGVHPVELVLTRPDGPELWRQTVFLNRLPEPGRTDTEPGPVRVTLVLPIGSAPAVGPDGAPAFSVEEQSQLGAAASLLERVPEAPLTLAVRPNTLDGLVLSDQRWAADLLDALDPQPPDSALVLTPYVEVDAGALVASDETTELQRQMLIGAATTADRIGRTPTVGTWAGDGSITTPVLPVLAAAGVTSLLLPLDSLDLADPADQEGATTSPVVLEGGDGIRALAYDAAVSQRIADSSVESGVRAHQSVSIMMAGWFDAAEQSEPPPLATAVLLSPTTDPAVLESLTSTLASGGPLVAEPDAGPLPDPAPEAQEPSVALVGRTTPDLRDVVAAANETRRQIASYRSMTGEADPDSSLWDQVANESVGSVLDAGARADLHAAVRSGIAAKVALIEPPRSRRVVVTGRDAVIPLRFRNGLPFEVRLIMRARSPRLDIADPTTEIVLQPGENRVDLPVTVQAPGESLLRIDLSSPDGGITIPGPDVPVRSTAISGVGAALSIVSALFLLGWWFRTMRRRRRERARDGGSHPSGEAPSAQVTAGRLDEGG